MTTKQLREYPQPTKEELEASEDPGVYLDGWIAACDILIPQVERLQATLSATERKVIRVSTEDVERAFDAARAALAEASNAPTGSLWTNTPDDSSGKTYRIIRSSSYTAGEPPPTAPG